MNKVNEKEYHNQKEIILAHLKKFGSLSTKEGYEKYMIMRVGSIINLLRKEGYNIITVMEKSKKRKTNYARYYLKQ